MLSICQQAMETQCPLTTTCITMDSCILSILPYIEYGREKKHNVLLFILAQFSSLCCSPALDHKAATYKNYTIPELMQFKEACHNYCYCPMFAVHIGWSLITIMYRFLWYNFKFSANPRKFSSMLDKYTDLANYSLFITNSDIMMYFLHLQYPRQHLCTSNINSIDILTLRKKYYPNWIIITV